MPGVASDSGRGHHTSLDSYHPPQAEQPPANQGALSPQLACFTGCVKLRRLFFNKLANKPRHQIRTKENQRHQFYALQDGQWNLVWCQTYQTWMMPEKTSHWQRTHEVEGGHICTARNKTCWQWLCERTKLHLLWQEKLEWEKESMV